MQTAYESVFTLPGFLISASMLAYLVAQLIDDISLLKRVNK